MTRKLSNIALCLGLESSRPGFELDKTTTNVRSSHRHLNLFIQGLDSGGSGGAHVQQHREVIQNKLLDRIHSAKKTLHTVQCSETFATIKN